MVLNSLIVHARMCVWMLAPSAWSCIAVLQNSGKRVTFILRVGPCGAGSPLYSKSWSLLIRQLDHPIGRKDHGAPSAS